MVALAAVVWVAPAFAQFTGAYSIVDGTTPAGVYNGSNINAAFNNWVGNNAISNTGILNTSSAPTSVFLSESGGSGYDIGIKAFLATDMVVSFSWTATSSNGGGYGYETYGGNFNPLSGASGTVTYTTTATDYVRFYVGGNSTQRSSLTISNFSVTAIPEPGTSALLAAGFAASLAGAVRLHGRSRKT